MHDPGRCAREQGKLRGVDVGSGGGFSGGEKLKRCSRKEWIQRLRSVPQRNEPRVPGLSWTSAGAEPWPARLVC